MKKNSERLRVIEFYFVVVGVVVFLIGGVVLARIEREEQYKKVGYLLDRIVSIETDKINFIDKYRAMVKEVNPKIDDVECVVVLSSIYENCRLYRLEPGMVLSVIENESRFVKSAKSKVGAIGYMQIMPSTAFLVARYIGMVDFDLVNTEQNIRIGCCFLAILLKYNDVRVALAMYNAGGCVEAGLGYADSVLDDMKKWQF